MPMSNLRSRRCQRQQAGGVGCRRHIWVQPGGQTGMESVLAQHDCLADSPEQHAACGRDQRHHQDVNGHVACGKKQWPMGSAGCCREIFCQAQAKIGKQEHAGRGKAAINASSTASQQARLTRSWAQHGTHLCSAPPGRPAWQRQRRRRRAAPPPAAPPSRHRLACEGPWGLRRALGAPAASCRRCWGFWLGAAGAKPLVGRYLRLQAIQEGAPTRHKATKRRLGAGLGASTNVARHSMLWRAPSALPASETQSRAYFPTPVSPPLNARPSPKIQSSALAGGPSLGCSMRA